MHFAWSFTGAHPQTAGHMSDSLDMQMLGNYSKLDGGELANGRTASPYSAEPSAPASGGFGMSRTTYGLKSSRTTKSDGFMWMHVKKPGTSHCFTQMAGEGKCLIVLGFLTMGLQM